MHPDPHTAEAGGQYLVRSLYYDTCDFAAVQERSNGDFGRIKLRIRSYTANGDNQPQLLIELKTKKGGVMEKYGSFVPYTRYLHFLQNACWDSPADPVLVEFERLYRAHSLDPVLLVQYEREGYMSKDHQPVRVTLDHNVHSARAREVFPDQLLLKPHRPRTIVLEIKSSRGREPDWLRSLVKQHSLKVVSNSKYVQGIEIIRPNMVTPRRIV